MFCLGTGASTSPGGSAAVFLSARSGGVLIKGAFIYLPRLSEKAKCFRSKSFSLYVSVVCLSVRFFGAPLGLPVSSFASLSSAVLLWFSAELSPLLSSFSPRVWMKSSPSQGVPFLRNFPEFSWGTETYTSFQPKTLKRTCF